MSTRTEPGGLLGFARRPLRRLADRLYLIRLRHLYGIRRPGWWPLRRAWPLGPRGQHNGREVVITSGSRRFAFQPAAHGRYRGHVYRGEPSPDVADLAQRLKRLDLPTTAARPLAAVSSFEGGFDSIQTCDHTRFCWGFIQFSVFGGLSRLLQDIKTVEPALFERYFRAAGVDVDRGWILTHGPGGILRGTAAANQLHDEPRLWRAFVLAAQEPAIRDRQVKAAHDHYYAGILERALVLPFGPVVLGELFAGDEYGRAALLDRAVQRGLGSTLALLADAARRADLRSTDPPRRLLEAASALEPNNRRRWQALRTAFDV